MHAKGHAITNVDWALWFAVFSPIIGVLLGVLGVFILAGERGNHEHNTFFKSRRRSSRLRAASARDARCSAGAASGLDSTKWRLFYLRLL